MENKNVHRVRITCPTCGFCEEIETAVGHTLLLHRCGNCNMQMRPTADDCCVICAYGTIIEENEKLKP